MLDGDRTGAEYSRSMYPQVKGAQYLPQEQIVWLATYSFNLLKVAHVEHITPQAKFVQSFVQEWQFQQGCEEGARRRTAELVTVGREEK